MKRRPPGACAGIWTYSPVAVLTGPWKYAELISPVCTLAPLSKVTLVSNARRRAAASSSEMLARRLSSANVNTCSRAARLRSRKVGPAEPLLLSG